MVLKRETSGEINEDSSFKWLVSLAFFVVVVVAVVVAGNFGNFKTNQESAISLWTHFFYRIFSIKRRGRLFKTRPRRPGVYSNQAFTRGAAFIY